MSNVNVKIDNIPVTVSDGTTILDAAKVAGVEIPTLCHLEGIHKTGACRICVVEANGSIQPACSYPVDEGMEVLTNTKRVRNLRKGILELIIANHDVDCTICESNRNCELQSLARSCRIEEIGFDKDYDDKEEILSETIIRDQARCIKCGRCMSICNREQEAGILAFQNRSKYMQMTTFYNESIDDLPCLSCGQCVKNCPVSALKERDRTGEIFEILEKESDAVKATYIMDVPMAAVISYFGLPENEESKGKVYSALRLLGFDKVFDDSVTNSAVIEEAEDFLTRFKEKKNLPMIMGCATINFSEKHDIMNCASKYANKNEWIGKQIKKAYGDDAELISVTACISGREKLSPSASYHTVSVRQFIKMIKQTSIDIKSLKPTEPDSIDIKADVNSKADSESVNLMARFFSWEKGLVDYRAKLDNPFFQQGVLELPGGEEVKIAMVTGGKAINSIFDDNIKDYDIIAVSNCPGGCPNGGGIPL